MYDPGRFEHFIAQEEQYLQDNFLPYMEETLPDCELVDRSDTARYFHEDNQRIYPLPVRDVAAENTTAYRVRETDLADYFFRATFAPQYFFVDEDAPDHAEEDGKYAIAVEHRGTFTVEAQDDLLQNDALRIADQWQTEAELLWEDCVVDRFDFQLETL